MFIDSQLQRRDDRLAEREQSLANWATVLTLTAILLVFIGTVASVVGFRNSERAAVHALVTAPFPVAIATAAVAFRLRRALVTVRERQEELSRGSNAAEDDDENSSSDPLAARVSPKDLLAIEGLLRSFYAARQVRPPRNVGTSFDRSSRAKRSSSPDEALLAVRWGSIGSLQTPARTHAT